MKSEAWIRKYLHETEREWGIAINEMAETDTINEIATTILVLKKVLENE